jgi:hypothetical protein
MPELIMGILEHAYAQHPWRSEGDDLPRDIALDPNGVLPVWWNQVQKTAALLDIPPENLPAILMRDTETLTGQKLIWEDPQVAPTPTQNYVLRAVLPAIAMDALHLLHQQEDVMNCARHPEIFLQDTQALTGNLVRGMPLPLLLNPTPAVSDAPVHEDVLVVPDPSDTSSANAADTPHIMH